MSLMALDNAVFDGAMQKRFHSERLVVAARLIEVGRPFGGGFSIKRLQENGFFWK
jgi:hypothetical protein